MDCKQVTKQDVLERYLLDQLTEPERDQFEQHYFECESCFSQLQTALTVQSQLHRYPSTQANMRGTFAWRMWSWTPALVTAVALLVIATWWYSVRRHAVQQVVVPSQGSQPQSANPRASTLEELALVDPPPYSAISFRGVEDQAHHQFDLAMQNYSKAEYARAIPGLRTAVRADPQVLSFNFYLAASYLLTGQTDSAIEFFRKTISLGDPSYSEQSHFYLAKAYLKKQDVSRAQEELRSAMGFHGSKEAEATQILLQLRR